MDASLHRQSRVVCLRRRSQLRHRGTNISRTRPAAMRSRRPFLQLLGTAARATAGEVTRTEGKAALAHARAATGVVDTARTGAAVRAKAWEAVLRTAGKGTGGKAAAAAPQTVVEATRARLRSVVKSGLEISRRIRRDRSTKDLAMDCQQVWLDL